MINKDYKINVECFVKDQIFDNRAIGPGIYIIELLKNNIEKSVIPLYIGKSVHMLKRSGEHLYETFKDPRYLGLSEDNMKDNKLKIRFRVLEDCPDNELLGKEKMYIKELNPITQFSTSDRMLDVDIKLQKVKEELEKI